MTTATDDEFLFLLVDVARLMRTRIDQRARRRGMTRAQWVILIWLERQSELSQNELATLVEVEPITVGRLVVHFITPAAERFGYRHHAGGLAITSGSSSRSRARSR